MSVSAVLHPHHGVKHALEPPSPVGLEGLLLYHSLLVRMPLCEVYCQSPHLKEKPVLRWVLHLALGSQLGFITLINNRIT